MPFVVPDACTLPTVERPLRLAEFETLFATAVRHTETLSPTRSRLRLSGPAGLEATVRDLTAREAACCSFFTFTVTAVPAPEGETVTLDIEVPPPYADVLAALTAPASAPPSPPRGDSAPPLRSKVSGALAIVACAACCALPVLIAAGVLTTAGAAILSRTLLAVSAGLAAAALGMWWLHRRRSATATAAAMSCGCAGGCGC